MKKLLCSLFVFMLLPALAVADDSPVDFGYTAIDVAGIYSYFADELDVDFDYDSVFLSSEKNYARIPVGNIEVYAYVNPITRNVSSVEICLSKYRDVEENAEDYGFLIGRSVVLFTGDKEDDFLRSTGLINSDIIDAMLDFSKSYSENGYNFEFVLDNSQYDTLTFTISCSSFTSVDIPISVSETLLDYMTNNYGLNISASFLYDRNSDLNNILGDDGSYISKINFAIAEISPDAESVADLSISSGGSIEVFRYENDAIARMNKVDNYSFFDPTNENYMFRYNNFLLRLSRDLPTSLISLYINSFISSVEAINP